jgi:transketolase
MNLNPQLYSTDIEQVPIRAGFGEGLLSLGQSDERIVALCADLTESTKVDAFAKAFPNRFIEMGIAEQSMASVASGMAAMGKIPFIASYAMFNPGRNWEQIRTTICYNNVPVKVIGAHAGVSVGPDGGTHQAIEDIALMRVIPRIVVIVPCDAIEARKATIALGRTADPTYLRLAREKSPVVTTEETSFEIGKAQVFYESPLSQEKKIGIIACGQLVHTALLAAKELENQGVEVGVLNLATIKPIDRAAIISFAQKYGRVLTAEEHQVAGGMGSAVAEVLAENYPVPMSFVGIRDEFGQSGTPSELMTHFKIDLLGVLEEAQKLLVK